MAQLPMSLNTDELAGLCSRISWEKHGPVISPVSMWGPAQFSQESKLYSFSLGEGFVGRMYEKKEQGMPHDATGCSSGSFEVLWDVQDVDPRVFLRKHVALLSGISSVVFLLADDGTLFELGFEHPTDAQAALSLLEMANVRCTSSHEADVGFGKSISNSIQQSPSSMLRHRFCSDESSLRGFVAESMKASTTYFRDDSPAWLRARSPSPWPRTRSPSPCRIEMEEPSIGSRGHPFTCQVPCKYHWKPSGCKDGEQCTRCHSCRFTKRSAKRSQIGSVVTAWPVHGPFVCGTSLDSPMLFHQFPCIADHFAIKT